MKKSLVVLTILVLVAGSAFAAISGTVTAQYDFDFSAKEVSYGVLGTNGEFAFELKADTTSVTGANKPYATVTVDIKYDGKVAKQSSDTLLEWEDGSYVFDLSGGLAVWSLAVSDFKVVGENWEIDFTKAIGAGGYAVSAWEKDDNKNNTLESHSLHAYWAFKESEGVTFTYDGFSVGIAGSAFAATPAGKAGYEVVTIASRVDLMFIDYDEDVEWFAANDPETTGIKADDFAKAVKAFNKAVGRPETDPNTAHLDVDDLPQTLGVYVKKTSGAEAVPGMSFFNLRAESKDLAVAEGVTVKAAAGVGYSKVGEDDATIDFGFAAKADYASEKVTANVGLDLQYVAKEFNVGVAATVKVAPVTVDAFFAKEVYEPGSRHFTSENYLSLRAVAVIDPVTVTVVAENLVNDDRLLGVKEEGTFGKVSENAQFGIYPSIATDFVMLFANAGVGYEVVENVKATANAGLVYLGSKDSYAGALAFKVGAEYEHELFKADANLYLSKGIASENAGGFYDTSMTASFEGCVSTDKIVENAVLSATLLINENADIQVYDSTHKIDDVANGNKKWNDQKGWAASARNALTLACKVAF